MIIHCGSLPRRQDLPFTGSHAVLVVGVDDQNVYLNDPDYSGARRGEGDHKPYTHAEFLKAWSDATLDGTSARTALIPSRGGELPMNVDKPTLDFLYNLIFHRTGPATSPYVGQPLIDVLRDMSLSGLWKELDAKLQIDVNQMVADAIKATRENAETECQLMVKQAAEAGELQVLELEADLEATIEKTAELEKELAERPAVADLSHASAIELFKELITRLFPQKGVSRHDIYRHFSALSIFRGSGA